MRVTTFTKVAAAAAVTSLALAGCSATSDSSGSADSSSKVTMWVYPVIADEVAHKKFWDETVAGFEAANEGVEVEYEIFPWANRDEALATAIAAGKGPDLVYLIPDQLSAYATSIEPMNAYLPAEQAADILPNVTDSITIDGNLMGAPLLTSSNPLVCNAAVFEAAGITEYPETWDDLLALAPQFKEKGFYVTTYPASPENTLNMTFYPLLWQAGGTVVSKDAGTVAFDSKAGTEALGLITDLFSNGYIEEDLISTTPALEQTAIATGKAACSWQNAPMELAPFWGEENLVILPPLKNKEAVAYGTVGTLAMLKGAADKDAAGAFASYATSADVVVPYLKTAGYFSALSSTGELYADDPILSAVEATVPFATVGQLFPAAREVMGVLSPEIQASLLGMKTPEQALKDAAAAASPLLAK